MKGFTHMRRIVWLGSWLLPLLSLTACSNLFPTLDLSPPYQPPEYVVPASWHGSSPFIEANPSDGDLRPDWWTLYDDPALNTLIEQAMAANPDLEAAAERFVQARDMMMKARSQYLPRLGLGFGASDNRASANALFSAIFRRRPRRFPLVVWPLNPTSGRPFEMPLALRPIALRSAPPTMDWHVSASKRKSGRIILLRG